MAKSFVQAEVPLGGPVPWLGGPVLGCENRYREQLWAVCKKRTGPWLGGPVPEPEKCPVWAVSNVAKLRDLPAIVQGVK